MLPNTVAKTKAMIIGFYHYIKLLGKSDGDCDQFLVHKMQCTSSMPKSSNAMEASFF